MLIMDDKSPRREPTAKEIASIKTIIFSVRFTPNSESSIVNDPIHGKLSVIMVTAVRVWSGDNSYFPSRPTATSFLKVLITNATQISLGSFSKPETTGLNRFAIVVIAPV